MMRPKLGKRREESGTMGGETRRGEVKEENGVKVELVLGGGWRRGG
jgi:hypothetical protein